MSVDHDPHITSPPRKPHWHLKLVGDHNELEEALEHVRFAQTISSFAWEDDRTLFLCLVWADERIAQLLTREINGMWPDIKILENKEVEQCQMRNV